jgi:DNA repair helicase Rad3
MQIVPKGMVVFFPSYVFMQSYIDYWEETKIMEEMEQYKQVCKDYKDSRPFKASFKKF